MWDVPRQRERLGWSVEMTVAEGAPKATQRAAQAFILEATVRPGPLRAALTRESRFGNEELILISPQRIINEATFGNPDDERNRALGILSQLFLTGGDQFLKLDALTQGEATAAAEHATSPTMARTRILYAVLGCMAASLDGQNLPTSLPAPRDPPCP